MTPKMKRDLVRFARICKFIWGDRWQAPASVALKFNERTVRAWVQGRTRITPPVWRATHKLLLKKLSYAEAILAMSEQQMKALGDD